MKLGNEGGIIPSILFYCLLSMDGNAVRNFYHPVPGFELCNPAKLEHVSIILSAITSVLYRCAEV